MKKNNWLILSICIFSFSICATNLNFHSLQEYKEAFSIKSLQKFILVDDPGLESVMFPDFAFNMHDDDQKIATANLINYITKKEPFKIFNTSYRYIYDYLRFDITNLEKQRVLAYFSLHRLITINAIYPLLEDIYNNKKNLGHIEQYSSLIHKMMKSYVDYLFGPLSTPHKIESDVVREMARMDSCPSWLKEHLEQARGKLDLEFNRLYTEIDEINMSMTKLSRITHVQNLTQELLKEQKFSVSVAEILPEIFPGNDPTSILIRQEIGTILIDILREKYGLDNLGTKDNLNNIILHNDLAEAIKNARGTFIGKSVIKKRSYIFKKKVTTTYFISRKNIELAMDPYLKKL
jgi:hypothetical protein